jgi:membrane protease YdiL (CAAX protease family)
MPPEMMRQLHRAIMAPERNLYLDLFALALTPALCEEALFRGVLLQATRRTMTTGWAVLINGVMFGLFHLNLWRFLPTMLLGMMLALIVLRAGSIWPAVLFHFLNNASAIVAGRMVGPEALEQPAEVTISWPLLAAAAAVFTLGVSLLRGQERLPAAGRPAAPD